MDDAIKGSEQLTTERYPRRQRLTRKRLYCATPEGAEVTAELLLAPLTDFLADKIKDNPPPLPPDELNDRLGRVAIYTADTYPAVALAILAPVLDAIARGWEGYDDNKSWKMLLAEQMGGRLCDWLALKEEEIARKKTEARLYLEARPLMSEGDWLALKKEMEASGAIEKQQPLIPGRRRGPKSSRKHEHSDWSRSECVEAGDWLLDVATRLSCFGIDENKRFCIAPEWRDQIDKICEQLLWRHPVMLPHTAPPADWKGWWANYGDRLRAPFVRDWRPQTRAAIEATFAAAQPFDDKSPFAALGYSLPFAHADGIDALKRVPLRINESLLPLVEKFAVELMRIKQKHDGDKLKADRKTVKADLRHARWSGNQSIYLDYNCDKRGRLYSLQQLNYAREDHVRALFEFDRGVPLGADGRLGVESLHWLEIHAANCGPGEVDKKPWADRLRWAKENTDLIERVAADPQNSFDLWRGADKPFAFVAACQELVRARKDLTGFITHLPIGFDGTCNGIQHLAMLARDEEAGRLVNLIDSDTPQDIYLVVTRHIMSLLENEDRRVFTKGREAQDAWCFDWWRNRLGELDERQRRKLFKNPIMTFPYNVTHSGVADKIVETYRSLFDDNEPQPAATRFLASAVRRACQDKLPGPVRIMKYIRALALHRFKQEKFLEWRTGTGFPVANMYHKPDIKDLDLGSGVRSRYTVADGALPERRKEKTLNSASPNFIHSLDATHLIRTVLAANSEDEGIRDILTVHDSLACLAPHARRFGQIIRRELAMLYIVGDPLANR